VKTSAVSPVGEGLPDARAPRSQEIMRAPNRECRLEGMAGFCQEFSARSPKAVETLTKDQNQLLTLFDFPTEHWIHLPATDPVESPLSDWLTPPVKLQSTASTISRS